MLMKIFLNTSQFTYEVYTYNSSWILTLNMFANCFLRREFYPGCDVMDFLNIQDGGWLVSLSFYVL